MLGSEPLAHEASALTTRLTWQMIVKNVKICAQQGMWNHLPVGSGQ